MIAESKLIAVASLYTMDDKSVPFVVNDLLTLDKPINYDLATEICNKCRVTTLKGIFTLRVHRITVLNGVYHEHEIISELMQETPIIAKKLIRLYDDIVYDTQLAFGKG